MGIGVKPGSSFEEELFRGSSFDMILFITCPIRIRGRSASVNSKVILVG